MSATRGMARFPASRTSRSQSGFNAAARDYNRRVLPGYPEEKPFRDVASARAYLALDPLPCLLCGKGYHALGAHLSRSHNISSRDYCDRYCLPYGNGLTSPSLHQAMRERQLLQTDRIAALGKRARESGSRPKNVGRREFAGRVISTVHKIHFPRECLTCRVTFTPKHPGPSQYCTKKCAGIARRGEKRPWLEKPATPCADCGVPSKGLRRGFCNRCRQRKRNQRRLSTNPATSVRNDFNDGAEREG